LIEIASTKALEKNIILYLQHEQSFPNEVTGEMKKFKIVKSTFLSRQTLYRFLALFSIILLIILMMEKSKY